MSKTDALRHNVANNSSDQSPWGSVAHWTLDRIGDELVFADNLNGIKQGGELILDLEDLKQVLKASIEAVNEQLERRKAEQSFMMVQQDLPYFPVRGKRIAPYVKHRYSPINGQGDPAIAAWLRDNDRGDIIKENIHANTFHATIAEIVEENGGEIPADLVDLVRDYEEQSVRITSD